MSIEVGQSLVDSYLASVRQDTTTHAFATWTVMGGKTDLTVVDYETGVPVVPRYKWFFEELTPAEYTQLYGDLMGHTLKSAIRGDHVLPKNERAHLSVLVLDVDSGNVPVHEMVSYGRLVQNTAHVHFNIRTEFVLAGRLDASGHKKYHLFFPSLVMSDNRLWSVISAIVRPFARITGSVKKIDTAPTYQRNLRMHGTEKTAGDQSGVYQVICAFDSNYRAMEAGNALYLTSVRPSGPVTMAWMLAPECVARTSIAAEKVKPVSPDNGALFPQSALVLDNDRDRLEVILTDRARGSWALCDVRRKCRNCDDVLRCRVLYRIDGVSAVFRWSICLQCFEFVSLPPLSYQPDGQGVHRYLNMTPNSNLVRLNVASLRHVYALPLELICHNGFCLTHNDREHLRLDGTVDIVTLGSMLSGNVVGWQSVQISLTAAQCGATDEALPRLATGLAAIGGLPVPPEHSQQIVLLKAPCGAGKTVSLGPLIAASTKTLVVAVRKALTSELTTRLGGLAPGRRVIYYGDVQKSNIDSIDSAADVLVVTPESLFKFVMDRAGRYKFGADLFVVDEICSVVKTLYESATTSRFRTSIQTAFLAAMAHARRVVFLDKDIGFGERLFLAAALCHNESIPAPPVLGVFVRPPTQIVDISMEDRVKRRVVFWPDRATMIADAEEKLAAGGAVAMFFTAKTEAFQAYVYLKDKVDDPSEALLMTGSSPESEKATFSADPNGVLNAKRVRVFIYTSTVGVGISIDRHRFTDVYVTLGSHMTWRDALQAEARVRELDGQSIWVREINVYTGNVSMNEKLISSMPTVGTALILAQNEVHSAQNLRGEIANSEQVALDGLVGISETPLGVAEATVRAIHELEKLWQMHFMFEWLDGHELVFKESNKIAETVQELKAANVEGKQLRLTQDLYDDDDDEATAKVKRAKVTDVVGEETVLERVIELAKSEAFTEWVRKSRQSLTCWVGVGRLAQSVAARAEAAAANPGSGIEGLGHSIIGPALLCIGLATVCGASAIFAGQAVTEPVYCDEPLQSPLDGRSVWSADQFFEWLSEVPIGSVQIAATQGVKTLLRGYKAPFKVPVGADVGEARAKYAYRALRALLGGQVAMSEPLKLMWTARKWSRDETLFNAVPVPIESPW